MFVCCVPSAIVFPSERDWPPARITRIFFPLLFTCCAIFINTFNIDDDDNDDAVQSIKIDYFLFFFTVKAAKNGWSSSILSAPSPYFSIAAFICVQNEGTVVVAVYHQGANITCRGSSGCPYRHWHHTKVGEERKEKQLMGLNIKERKALLWEWGGGW